MKHSTLSAIALTAAAVAAPADVEVRNNLGDDSQKQVCCTPILGIPLLSSCLTQIAGSSCKNEAFCCQANQVNGPIVSSSLLHFNETKDKRSLGLAPQSEY